MANKERDARKIVTSLDQVPDFVSEDEEREWWTTHDLAVELGKDITDEHHARILKLKAKYRYVPSGSRKSKAA